MVKLHGYQQQFANMVFVLAGILTLAFRLPLEIRMFIVFSLIGVALLSNRHGIKLAGVALGIASMSFLIMFFFGDHSSNTVPLMEGYMKALIAVIYTLILFGSVLHLIYESPREGE